MELDHLGEMWEVDRRRGWWWWPMHRIGGARDGVSLCDQGELAVVAAPSVGGMKESWRRWLRPWAVGWKRVGGGRPVASLGHNGTLWLRRRRATVARHGCMVSLACASLKRKTKGHVCGIQSKKKPSAFSQVFNLYRRWSISCFRKRKVKIQAGCRWSILGLHRPPSQ